MKYTEIFKLKERLEEANIPFQFLDRSFTFPESNIQYEKYQICYPEFDVENRIISVIEGNGTYGAEYDTLEIKGLLTKEESKEDSVVGYLTYFDVFDRIYEHYKKNRKGGE